MSKLLKSLCSLPTAPFAEDRVIAYVESFVAKRPALELSRDSAGNLLIELPTRSRKPRWVFAAHMDHPGFVAREMTGGKTLHADFFGGVLADYVQGTSVRFFDGADEIKGKVVSIDELSDEKNADRRMPRRVTVRVGREVQPGAPGMFDVGPGRSNGSRFQSRVCDNLAGAAAALQMLDDLLKKPAQTPAAVLLTRGEEEGFIGAVAAAIRPKLLRKSDRLIVIECSAEQPVAKQGQGPIIRVGDRVSVFNSSLTYFINHVAEQLGKRSRKFQHQRALMPGGACEATVYDVFGFQTASICIALGNYHNMDRKKQRIAPEYIHIDDWKQMAKLFAEIARKGHEYRPGHQLLKSKLRQRFNKLKKHL